MNDLVNAAKNARSHAYSPYSGHKVGAAIRVSGGKIYGGCNIENSSYGATLCAERCAISQAVSENGKVRIEEVLVLTDAPQAWPPCGLCRQVIAEFAAPDLKVHLTNVQGSTRTIRFADLFPEAFTPDYLSK